MDLFKIGSNQILLLVCLVLVATAGTYLTYIQQENTLSELQDEIEQKEDEQQRIQELYTELSDSEERARTALMSWRTRYKLFPTSISTPEMVGYLTDLTQNGFKSFDVVSAGSQSRDGYRFHTFSASGTAYFYHLYRFLWKIENNRSFYRVRDLTLEHVDQRETDEESGRTDMDILVSFDMEVDAFYGAPEGIPARQDALPGSEIERLPVAKTNHRPPVPSHVLPTGEPSLDPFYPLILDQIPPNQYDRLNVETAPLVSIVQGQAVFKTGDGLTRLGEGDRVYLGRIITVDPKENRVVARLNKGGIVDTVELRLDVGGPRGRSGPRDEAPDPQQ